jgi:hypothetical protein
MTSNPARRNPWILLAGAAVLVALAIGLLDGGADAAPVGATGYGTSPPPVQTCTMGTGYNQTPCDPEISGLKNKPSRPVKGKGFVVSFETKSGGQYHVFVEKNGFKKGLANGVVGVGAVKTKRIGKGVKAGKYKLGVSIKSNDKTATAKRKLVVRKP